MKTRVDKVVWNEDINDSNLRSVEVQMISVFQFMFMFKRENSLVH